MTQIRTKEDKGFAFEGSNRLKNIRKRPRIKQNTVIFKERGCVTLIRKGGQGLLLLVVHLTQKDPKTVMK